MADMRERLIELIQDAVNGCARHWAEIIADHLLTNGALLLPCNVGDTVYGFHQKNVLPYSVKWLETDDCGEWWVVAQHPPMAPRSYKLEGFGNTVFLTKEEAEQALKERGADG